ncbi:light harvesting complex protein [Tribonema minus]|uniref:Light harvesting complex protein n=1 Tax=Tribonema minus TaxID=303371 RepID=A0A835ZEM5_9STRA|nr:light harvesting complex protein [Tribonema minus]
MVKAAALALVACSGVAAYQAPSMVFGKKAGAKTGKERGPPAFLREPEPGTGPAGAWYVREDPTLSTALPWVTKPVIGDGDMIGDFGFDPLSLSKTFDISWLRAAELKHGRVCMLAAVGLVTPELVQHPVGFDGFAFPAEFTQMNAIAALGAVPKFGLAQIVLACGLIEIATFGSNYNSAFNYEDGLSLLERAKLEGNERTFLTGVAKTTANINKFGNALEVGFEKPGESDLAGDLGFDPLGLSANGVRPDYALAEIKHARLAMIGVLGMLLGQFYEPSKGVLQQTLDWAAAQA